MVRTFRRDVPPADDGLNRLTLTRNGFMVSNTHDAPNRLTARGTMTYGSDANGNRTSETREGSTTTYSYDERDELTAVSEGTGASTSYTVNGDGQRVSSTTGGATTPYTYDAAGQLTGVRNDAGWYPGVEQSRRRVLSDSTYDYLLDARGEVVARRDRGGTVTYVHRDAAGSVRRTTDASGAVTSAVDYDALGARRAQSGQPLLLGYRGGVTDATTGLVVLKGGSTIRRAAAT